VLNYPLPSLPCEPDVPAANAAIASNPRIQPMDKKQINSPKMTLNFLIWVGGVFMLLLFGFLAHFVWRIL
jgi:hypothetical protein